MWKLNRPHCVTSVQVSKHARHEEQFDVEYKNVKGMMSTV